MLDEADFLSPYGVRALSRYHCDHRSTLSVDGTEYQVPYDPAESSTSLFGGNSNWRGPIWFLAHRMPGLRWRQAVRCGIL